MSRSILTGLAFAALASVGFAQDGGIFYRPDGNGYFYYEGARPYRSIPAYPGPGDHEALHGELAHREYDRSQIADTAARYGQLTAYQRMALEQMLREGAVRDDVYHRGYTRAERANAPLVPDNRWYLYDPYQSRGGYGQPAPSGWVPGIAY